MSRVLVIGSHTQVSREIGDALVAADFPIEYSVGHADSLQRLRKQSFGVVITHPHSTVEEDLALLEEMRTIRPGVKTIVLAQHSTPDEVIAALRAECSPALHRPLTRVRSQIWPVSQPLKANGEKTSRF